MHRAKMLERHAALVDAMSDRLGIDVEEAVLRGDIDLDEISEAVLRCSGCSEVSNCEHFLETVEGHDMPSYCRNAALFRRLGSLE